MRMQHLCVHLLRWLWTAFCARWWSSVLTTHRVLYIPGAAGLPSTSINSIIDVPNKFVCLREGFVGDATILIVNHKSRARAT